MFGFFSLGPLEILLALGVLALVCMVILVVVVLRKPDEPPDE
jgi:hypothetical protein